MNTAAKSNTWGEGKLGRSWKGRHYYPSCTYLSYQKLNEFGGEGRGHKKVMSVWKFRGDMRFSGRVLLVCTPPESLQEPCMCSYNCMLYEHKTLESEEHTLKPCARWANCSTFNFWSLVVKKKKNCTPGLVLQTHSYYYRFLYIAPCVSSHFSIS